MAQVLGVCMFLALVKLYGGICPIVVGEAFYQLVSKVLCLQFHDAFIFHLSPYEFRVMIKGGCETMIHGI
jgi:hypothetical protein